MGAAWEDPPRAPRRVVAIRLEVDAYDAVDDELLGHEHLARAMEASAARTAQLFGVVTRERRLYIDRAGSLVEIATEDR